MSTELIVLEENKKIVEFNSSFEVLKDGVIEKLKANEYNSIVTMENFPVMKKTMQELNGIAKNISDFRIAKVKEESKDLKQFEDNFKELAKFPKDKAEEIKKGLAVFEEETKKQVNLVCSAYMGECLDSLNIRAEFRLIDISDMVQTGFMTASGVISKKGRDEVVRRVNMKHQLQTKVDNRLLSLENECLKNEIEPLTQEHIQGFLYEEDEVYANKLSSLINAEVRRNLAIQEKATREANIKAEAEAKEKVLEAQKAEKEELEKKYLPRIASANKDQLLIINIELQSYSGTATYDIKKASGDREIFLNTPVAEEVEEIEIIEESPQEQHLKDILKEVPKEETVGTQNYNRTTKKIGMIKKRITVIFDIEVPKIYEDRVVDIYTDRFKENIKSVKNLKVVADDI